jgi:hypothetical protein
MSLILSARFGLADLHHLYFPDFDLYPDGPPPPLYPNKCDTPSLSPFRGNSWYVLHSIYSLEIPSLACLDFIKQISIFWPAGPRYQAYLNEYDAHSLYPLRFDFQCVFNAIYLLGFALITSFDFIIWISTF